MVVHYLDVGQGDATLLRGPDFAILIDAGRHDRSDVVPYLRSVDLDTLDLLIGTHPHADHIGQFPQVLEAFSVGEVWLSGDLHDTLTFERALDAIEASDAGYHEPRAGEALTIGSARIEVVNPDRLTGDLHEGSISVRIVFGEIAFMFTGDAEARSEEAMVARGHDLRSHVLQLGHHGSRTSSSREFLEAVQPEVAIYSAGQNNQFGHPHPEPLANLAELEITVYGTDVNGTILVVTDGRDYAIEVVRVGEPRAPPTAEPVSPAVPTPIAEDDPPPSACGPEQVDINRASEEDLQQIVHIGSARAAELIEKRPYTSVDQLTRVSGIAAGRLGDIKEQAVACVE